MLYFIAEIFREKRILIRIICAVFILMGVSMRAAYSEDRVSSIKENLIETDEVLPENEGKLVMISGVPTVEDGGIVEDEELGLSAENVLSYTRMPYQKVYIEVEEKIVDKGKDKIKSYDDKITYKRYVSTDWIYSNGERESSVGDWKKSYENPDPVNMSSYVNTFDLQLGEFTFSSTKASDYIHSDMYKGFSEEELKENEKCREYINNSEIPLEVTTDGNGNGMLSSGDNVGDIHVVISYNEVESIDPVTIIGVQVGNRIEFDEKDELDFGENIMEGELSKEEYLEKLRGSDKESRGYGTGFMVAGIIGIILTFAFSILKIREGSNNPTQYY